MPTDTAAEMSPMGNGCSRTLEDGVSEDAGGSTGAFVDKAALQTEPPCSGDEPGRLQPSAPDAAYPAVKRHSKRSSPIPPKSRPCPSRWSRGPSSNFSTSWEAGQALFMTVEF
ncbi:hypothetical protein V5799_005901 [Amblyomma americanum]|uniref:Uncharacterized protein n=1 Tax=Amblyomma americanum TaxID=6943 RepID=A0AAQ4DXX8_AMBAM